MMNRLMIVSGLLFIGCANDHLTPQTFNCDPNNPISFDAVAPVLTARCATKICHSASNAYIPHLESREQVTANRADCKTQLANGAMPPSGYPLTEAERAKILCWLNFGQ